MPGEPALLAELYNFFVSQAPNVCLTAKGKGNYAGRHPLKP